MNSHEMIDPRKQLTVYDLTGNVAALGNAIDRFDLETWLMGVLECSRDELADFAPDIAA